MAHEKAMYFVDGTNVFNRLWAARLRLPSLKQCCSHGFSHRWEIARIYVYTIKEQAERAKSFHGSAFLDGCRMVYGDAISRGDGNVAEKCVDALLVADLVYHAAAKNYALAVVVTHDTDFRYALRRIEDFGCRSAVLAICEEAPPRLREMCDVYRFVSREMMMRDFGAQLRSS